MTGVFYANIVASTLIKLYNIFNLGDLLTKNMQQNANSPAMPQKIHVPGALTAGYFFVFIGLLSLVIAILAFYMRAPQRYFVYSPSNVETELFPLNEPNVTPSSLIKWATMAATSAYTLDFYQYQANIDALREFFTTDGYAKYLQSLDASDSLSRIISEKLIVSAVATDTAVILQEGELSGVYTWRLQIPLLLSYQGASESSVQKTIVVSLIITRVPTTDAPKGIGIAQILDADYYAQN